VRKNHVAPRAAEKLLIYVKKPVMQILGIADFVECFTGSTSEAWATYGAETCFASFDEYCQFAQGRTEMTSVQKLHRTCKPEIHGYHTHCSKKLGIQRRVVR